MCIWLKKQNVNLSLVVSSDKVLYLPALAIYQQKAGGKVRCEISIATDQEQIALMEKHCMTSYRAAQVLRIKYPDVNDHSQLRM